MPSTTQNIDLIQRRVEEQSRPTILDMLNEVQTIVYSQDCKQTLKITDRGMPPFIATTEGVHQYTCPSDCRRTEMVFRRHRHHHQGNEGDWSGWWGDWIRRRLVEPISTTSRDANINTPAILYFTHNPGTHNERYYHAYYLLPPKITNEDTDQLIIPEELHYLVREMVVALFTSEAYGQSQLENSAVEKTARKIRNQLNRGTFWDERGLTAVQPEFQDEITPYYGQGSQYHYGP